MANARDAFETGKPRRALQDARTAKNGDLTERETRNAGVVAKVGKVGLAELQEQRKRLYWLEETATALRSNIDFLFRRDVADPGITQLLGLMPGTDGGGFFTPDPEQGGEADAKRGAWSGPHGYNLEFFKAMVRHGFDLAVAWEATPDTMHFELIEGRRLAESGGSRQLTAGTHSH